MHAVVRTYAGGAGREFFDLLDERKAEIESLIRSVEGFESYTLIKTDDGGISVTVCQDKKGTDQSVKLARLWRQRNAAKLGLKRPTVSEGSAILQLC